MPSLCQSLVVLTLLGVTSAFIVIRTGRCPTPPVKQDFDVTRYTGKWWEYQRFPAPFEYGVVCGFANYTLIASDKVKVVNSGIQEIKFLWWVISRKPTLAVGEAVIVNPSEPSKLQVSFGGMPAGSGEPNYFVVDTDYDNYAVVYSCSGDSLGLGNVQFAWILTRAQGVRPANLEQIHNTLKESGVDISPFITVDHSNCD